MLPLLSHGDVWGLVFDFHGESLVESLESSLMHVWLHIADAGIQPQPHSHLNSSHQSLAVKSSYSNTGSVEVYGPRLLLQEAMVLHIHPVFLLLRASVAYSVSSTIIWI